MRRCAVFVLVVVLLLATAAVPAAAEKVEVPEERIFLLCSIIDPAEDPEGWVATGCASDEFPADTPFTIFHGVFLEHGQGYNQKGQAPAVGHFDFKLFVDGEEVEWVTRWRGWTSTLNVFVFDGFADGETVEFTGEWYGWCTFEDLGVQEGCEKPSDTWMFHTESRTMTFAD